MRLKLLIGAACVCLAACANIENTDVDTVYAVSPGHWTSNSMTVYSGDAEPREPYVHDWCLASDEVTITATELAEAIAEFVSEKRGVCKVDNMDDRPYELNFELNCVLGGTEMSGDAVMKYARDGKTTDMDVKLMSNPGSPAGSFSRESHQKHLSETCPPGVE